MNEQELKKKLAEWAGFILYWEEGATDGLWQYPDEPTFQKRKTCPDFTQSLDACFKWLVPKYISEACVLPMGLTSIMSVYTFLFIEWLKVMNDKVEPALALCLAIEKLIEQETK